MTYINNVVSGGRASSMGLNTPDYTYDVNLVKPGFYDVTLDFKIWCKGWTLGIQCYFSDLNSDLKVVLTVFRDRITEDYLCGGIDFKLCPLEQNFKIEIAKTRTNKLAIRNAKIL